jgi:branched-chain amino acid transport system permease protein
MVLVPLSEILRNPRGLVQVGVLGADSGVVRFIETYLSNAHLLVYGVLVVVVILFAPDGVLGVVRKLLARSRRGRASTRTEPSPA